VIDVADEATARNGGTASPATSALVRDAGSATALPAPRPDRGGRRGLGEGPRKALEIALFTGPALLIFAVFVVYPVIRAIHYSLYKWKGYGPMVDFVGLSNYVTVLGDSVFQGALKNNLIIMVASIAIQLPLGLALALLLNRKMAGRNVLRTIVFVPYVLAEVVTGVIWRQMLQADYGLIDTIAGAIGLPTPQQGFLGDPSYAMGALMVVLTWKYLGLAVVLMLAGLTSVPEELYEAAQIDGASWWQVQRKITIPLLGPTIRTWAFLSMIGSIQVFDMVWILTKGGPANATQTMATFLYSFGVDRNLYGIASAASVILFVIALIFALTYQRIFMREDHGGGSPTGRTSKKSANKVVIAR
jgi:raffinose/stachyose/melibiose transport system permease protein